MNGLTTSEAIKIIDSAKKKAEAMDVRMNIAVYDSGANLIAFLRMDGAWLGSIDIAQKKAKTAVYFNMNSGEIGKLSQPGGSLYNIEHSNDGLITFPGGVVIMRDNQVVGSIGVSGSSVEDDHMVATAGASIIK